MANILLLDPNEVARRAMHGILSRDSHRCVAVDTVNEAWDFIRRNVRIDLVFVELDLKEGSGMSLIQKLKDDCLLKALPVVIYTAKGDRDTVKRGLMLHVQNFLIKPYRDDTIFAEIGKALENPWRQQHFEEENSFCKMIGINPEQMHKMLDALRSALELARVSLLKWAELKAARPACGELNVLSKQAEETGAWGVVDSLKSIGDYAKADNWTEFVSGMETLEFSGRLIFQHLNPDFTPLEFLSDQKRNNDNKAREHAVWTKAPAEHRCPVVSWAQLQRELENLAGCPIIDSAIASFQMSATGHPSCLSPLMDLVDKDPGLAAQMLIAANQAKHPTENDPSDIEDPRLAVGMLGELRLASIARSLVPAQERLMSIPPWFSWQQYWMFQIGTARTAKLACQALELHDLAALAYTSGLLHDLGEILLLRLHPFGLQAILSHVYQNGGTIREAERLFLGSTTQEMAVHFAEKQGLPRRFINVIRWVHSPQDATEDKELVAVVSLARDLCRHNQVGCPGEKSKPDVVPIELSPEWRVLRECVFPGFNLKNFEHQVHAECRELKLELHGRLANYAVA